jgi:hypothetical protein
MPTIWAGDKLIRKMRGNSGWPDRQSTADQDGKLELNLTLFFKEKSKTRQSKIKTRAVFCG